MNPIARKDKLTIRELPDEAVIYDLERHKMHCLNRTAALVWKHCDGRHDPAALAALLGRELLLSADEAAAAARLALEQLGRRHLLVEAVAPPEEEERLSRRAALRKMAVAAAAVLPLVMTLKSPSVAWAQAASTCSPAVANSCPMGFTCQPVGMSPSEPTGPHSSKAGFPNDVFGCVNNITGMQLQTPTTTTTTTTKGPCVANGGACTGTNGTQGNCCAGLCLGGFCSA